jgi:hypothetical protein
MRRALLVGINDYGTSAPPLAPCVADAWRRQWACRDYFSRNMELNYISIPGL